MKPLLIILVALFLILQYKLWVEEGGFHTAIKLNAKVAVHKQENQRAKRNNEILFAQVQDLKDGNAAIEEQARTELNMIKRGEAFYQIIGQTKEKQNNNG